MENRTFLDSSIKAMQMRVCRAVKRPFRPPNLIEDGEGRRRAFGKGVLREKGEWGFLLFA